MHAKYSYAPPLNVERFKPESYRLLWPGDTGEIRRQTGLIGQRQSGMAGRLKRGRFDLNRNPLIEFLEIMAEGRRLAKNLLLL